MNSISTRTRTRTRTPQFGLALLMGLAATSAVWADAKGDLQAAAKRLSEAKNYSWTRTVDLEGMPFRPGPTQGKRIKDGFTWISSEMMGNTSEAYLQGTKGVVQLEGEWKTEAELPQPRFGGPGGPGGPGGRPGGGGAGQRPPGERPPGERPPGGGNRPEAGGPRGGPGGPGGPGGRGGFAAMGARRLLETQSPHEEILALADKAKDLKAVDGAIMGELPEEAAKELASFGRRPRGGPGGGGGGFGPANAKGWIKIKLTDGQITKAILEIESEMRAPDGGTQTINAITTTEIKDVGTTQLEIPAAVKAKLEKSDK